MVRFAAIKNLSLWAFCNSFSDMIYLTSGCKEDKTPVSEVIKFDLRDEKLTPIVPFSRWREGHSVAVCGKFIFVFGGYIWISKVYLSKKVKKLYIL